MKTIKSANDLSTYELAAFLIEANKAYRDGTPIIDDETYDHVYIAELAARDPNHAFLLNVEPESSASTGKVRHVKPMLSTAKAFNLDAIIAFVHRIETAASELGLDPASLLYRVTPKLDGQAGNYTDAKLVSRGNGEVGTNVTHALRRGVVPIGGANTGLGEIVLCKAYWEKHLRDRFAHPRNVIIGLVGADSLSDDTSQILSDRAAHFVPFAGLESALVSANELIGRLDTICGELENSCQYPTDGSVIEVTDENVKEFLGATSHHYRWQISKKAIGDTAVSTVQNVSWHTGRTGRVTPVIGINKTWLSGAWIEHVTAHHAGNVRNLQIGIGCEISLVRSGEVIPKLLGITRPGDPAAIPTNCPTCDGNLDWERDFLVCGNSNCAAQISSRLAHFFSTIGNIDLFGDKTIDVLLEHGFKDLPSIYKLKARDFESMGFGPKQAQNLVRELKRSVSESVEDWRFLASFGIRHLGKGDSRRLLEHFHLADLPCVEPDQIQALDFFGPLKATRIASELESTWPLIASMLALGFTLNRNKQDNASESPISGLNIVFTGKMEQSRQLHEERALQLGANAQSSVNRSTDLLVIGANVGAKKLEAASKNNTRVVTEAEYLELLKQSVADRPSANQPIGVPVNVAGLATAQSIA